MINACDDDVEDGPSQQLGKQIIRAVRSLKEINGLNCVGR